MASAQRRTRLRVTPYQGLTDGAQHTYAFYSIGIDSAGNTQSAPSTPNLSSDRDLRPARRSSR